MIHFLISFWSDNEKLPITMPDPIGWGAGMGVGWERSIFDSNSLVLSPTHLYFVLWRVLIAVACWRSDFNLSFVYVSSRILSEDRYVEFPQLCVIEKPFFASSKICDFSSSSHFRFQLDFSFPPTFGLLFLCVFFCDYLNFLWSYKFVRPTF